MTKCISLTNLNEINSKDMKKLSENGNDIKLNNGKYELRSCSLPTRSASNKNI